MMPNASQTTPVWQVVSKRTGEVWATTSDPDYLKDWVTKDNFEMRPLMTPEQRARLAYQTIEAFGWSVVWKSEKPVPDDAWPIDIIRRQIEEACGGK